MHPLQVALEHCINGNPDESERILREQPQSDFRVKFNLGWHDMRHGRMHDGFKGLHAGRSIGVFGSSPLHGTMWDGHPLQDKTLLFRCEGGYGDQICNVRFSHDFTRMGARVIIACASELVGLFASNGYNSIPDSAIQHVKYDYWIPAMSSAGMLRYEYETMNGEPFIHASRPRSLFQTVHGKRVGLRWSGNPRFEHEQHRKFPRELLLSITKRISANYYSLQRDTDTILDTSIADMQFQMKTWEDTADIVAGLDLVITSCTSIAHLSGAMGIPTWVVVPIMPYYTWAYPSDTSVWYDSVRLYRQTKYGEWGDVFDRVESDLKEFCE